MIHNFSAIVSLMLLLGKCVGTDLSRPRHERSNVRVPLSRTRYTNYRVLLALLLANKDAINLVPTTRNSCNSVVSPRYCHRRISQAEPPSVPLSSWPRRRRLLRVRRTHHYVRSGSGLCSRLSLNQRKARDVLMLG